MSEIEKMYKNAGFKKQEIENCTYKNSTPCGHICDDGEDCPYLEIKEDYPPFTAEKLLKLIEWCAEWEGLNLLKTSAGAIFISHDIWADTLEEVIAKYINEQFTCYEFGEEEKEQIKEILK